MTKVFNGFPFLKPFLRSVVIFSQFVTHIANATDESKSSSVTDREKTFSTKEEEEALSFSSLQDFAWLIGKAKAAFFDSKPRICPNKVSSFHFQIVKIERNKNSQNGTGSTHFRSWPL